MRIAFIWMFDRASEIMPNWRDGLRAALEEISKKHEVVWFLDKKLPNPAESFDFVLFWDDSNSQFFREVDKYNCRKGICLSTDPHNLDNLRKLDVVYCESEPVYDAVRNQGLRAIKAFGTDTNFFRPKIGIYKDIEYFYPATFSSWKRQSEIAYLGDKLLCVGTVQPDGQAELEACIKSGVNVEIGYFPAEKIRDYYQKTQKMIIPAVHGSERTVLEAMSCNIIPHIVHQENIKTRSYIREFIDSDEKNPRDFVLKNYSHEIYARKLLRGIENV